MDIHNLVRLNSGVPLPEIEPTNEELTKEELSAVKTTLRVQWLQDTVTQQFFSDITKQVGELEQQARDLACSYAKNQNHLEIVNLLVRSSVLRKLKQTYGSTSNN